MGIRDRVHVGVVCQSGFVAVVHGHGVLQRLSGTGVAAERGVATQWGMLWPGLVPAEFLVWKNQQRVGLIP